MLSDEKEENNKDENINLLGKLKNLLKKKNENNGETIEIINEPKKDELRELTEITENLEGNKDLEKIKANNINEGNNNGSGNRVCRTCDCIIF